MATSKNVTPSRSSQSHFVEKSGYGTKMSITSYLLSSIFTKRSSRNFNDSEYSHDDGKVNKLPGRKGSEAFLSAREKDNHSILYHDNTNTNIAGVNSIHKPIPAHSNGVLSTSKPDGSISAKNIRSVKVSQNLSSQQSKVSLSYSNHPSKETSSISTTPTSNVVGHSGLNSGGQPRQLFSPNNKSISSIQPIVDNFPTKSSSEDSSATSHQIRKSSGVNIPSTLVTQQLPQPSNTSKISTNKPLCCDKCDGKHLTDDCPYYKKKRDDHPDAQRGDSKQKLGGFSLLPGSTILRAKASTPT